jgi:hypothetical protein
MSQAHLVSQIYEAWNAGNPGVQYLAPDFEFHQSASFLDLGPRRILRGHEEMFQAGSSLAADLRDLNWEPQDFIAAAGRIVVPFRLHAVGRTTGVPTVMLAVHVSTVRDELAIRCDMYEHLSEALEAAGPPAVR